MLPARSAPGAHPLQFDGILVDLFGTLIPMGHQEARLRNLEEMGRILDLDPATFTTQWLDCGYDRFRGRLGSLERTVERLALAQGVRPNSTAIHRALEVRLELTRGLLARTGPSLPALDALRAAGLRLGLVSDTSEETVRLWPATPLSSRFDVAVFSWVEGTCKPDPRMYRKALEGLGLPPAKCAYVGDGGSRELSGAEAVGLSAFMYRYPVEEDGALSRLDEDTGWTGTKLTDLRELLRFAPNPPDGS